MITNYTVLAFLSALNKMSAILFKLNVFSYSNDKISYRTLQLAQLIDDTSQPPHFTETESECYKGFSVC